MFLNRYKCPRCDGALVCQVDCDYPRFAREMETAPDRPGAVALCLGAAAGRFLRSVVMDLSRLSGKRRFGGQLQCPCRVLTW
jgi:hypothetical protein